MDLYRTFPNLLYLTAGRSLPWIPETVTWTLITVSIDHQFILGCKVGRLSNLMQFYLPPCIVPRESCFVWAGVEVIQSFFSEVKKQGAVAMQLKIVTGLCKATSTGHLICC